MKIEISNSVSRDVLFQQRFSDEQMTDEQMAALVERIRTSFVFPAMPLPPEDELHLRVEFRTRGKQAIALYRALRSALGVEENRADSGVIYLG